MEHPFEGVCPVVSTPFSSDGSVDHGSLERLLRAQIDRGADAAILFGVVGEFYKLSLAERRAVVETASSVCDGAPIDLVVSVTDHATTLAAGFAAFAADAGADGLMLLPPHFLGPGRDAVERHVARVAEGVDCPLMLQYAPEQTGVTLPPAAFVDLADRVDPLCAFKIESRPPGPDVSAIVEATDDGVSVLVGYAGLNLLEALDRGADGVVPGAANADVYRRIYDSYRAGDRRAARAHHEAILPLVTHTFQSVEQLIHYEKRMLAEQGLLDDPTCREPAFAPDDRFDELFAEHYETLRERVE
jgi:4-hydroxy-tetrahydrodipicolinate synthase